MSDVEIHDLSSNHHNRTELPNIIFEIGLSPTLIGVYAAIKKCAGDSGRCWKSENTLAKELCISKTTLHKYIELLCLEIPYLKKQLLIKEKRVHENGHLDTNLIYIIDIWPNNVAHFYKATGGRVNSTLPRVKSTQGVGQNLRKGRVKSTHKQDTINKIPINKTTEGDAVGFFDCLIQENRLNDIQKKDLMSFPEDLIKSALEYSSNVKIRTTLMATLVWYCTKENPPQIFNTQDVKENKEFAKKMESIDHAYRFEALKSALLISKGGSGESIEVKYKLSHDEFVNEIKRIAKIKDLK